MDYDMTSPDDQLAAGDPASGLPGADVAPLGTGTWVDVVDFGVPPIGTVRVVEGQFSYPYTNKSAGVRVRVQQWKESTTPQPPPTPSLSSLTLTPAVVVAGNPTQATLQLSAPWNGAGATVVTMVYPVGVSGPPQVGISAGQQAASVQLQTTQGPGRVAVIQATHLAKTVTAQLQVLTSEVVPDPKPPDPLPIPSPTPKPPAVTRTVDCTGYSQAQLQAELNKATAGTELYLGPGRYTFPATPTGDGQMVDFANKDGVTLRGAGGATILDFGGKEGIWCRPSNLRGQGNCIRDLAITNCKRAVAALDPQKLWVLNLAVSNCGIGYASERTGAFDGAMYEWPVFVDGLVVNGWAAHGIMLHGGETIRNCQLIDTPGNQGSTYSHGLYIQGAKNVTIEDVTIENTSGHSWQIYSDSATHAANGAENIVMRRVVCRKCFYGPVIACNGPYKNIVIDNLSVIGTVSRDGGTFVISATNDTIDGLTISNLLLDGGAQGLILQGGATGLIKNMLIDKLTINAHSTGIWIAPDGWPYTKIESSVIKGYVATGVAIPVRGTVPPGLSITTAPAQPVVEKKGGKRR